MKIKLTEMKLKRLINKPLTWLFMLQLFLLNSFTLLAQDGKGIHVDIGTGPSKAAAPFYTAWWFWLIIVMLFVIIIVAITSNKKKS